jgi:hypothetical protein
MANVPVGPVKREKADTPNTPRRTCGAMAVHMALLETEPSFRTNQATIENEIATFRMKAFNVAEEPVLRVRVIVHVVYNTASENISDDQINSQIHALNADFRATNPDQANVPAAFSGLVADSRITFELSSITRTRTQVVAFGADDSVKSASSGGKAAEDPEQYLNIWACTLSGGILGYAQFPGGPSKTDGVVILNTAFGTLGSATFPFDKGRTATHEVGHFLNLRHIWGDTPDCSGSDMVADTPNCAGPNYGAPGFPVVTCNNGPDGDMFMNYMDYVDDAAMLMFTEQQVLRMRATLSGPRRSIAL